MLSIYLNYLTIYLYLNLYLYYIYLFMNLVISISIYSFIDSLICRNCVFQKNGLLPHPGLPGSQHVSNVRSFVGCARRSLEWNEATGVTGPRGHGRDGQIQKSRGFYAFDPESSPYFCVKTCVLPITSPYFDFFGGKMIRMYLLTVGKTIMFSPIPSGKHT